MFDGESIVAYELVIHEAAALEIALFDFLIKIFWRDALQAEFAKAVFDRYFPEARLAKKELIFGAHKLIVEVWFDFSSIDKTPQQEVRVEKNVHKSTNSSSVISQSSLKETVALPSKSAGLYFLVLVDRHNHRDRLFFSTKGDANFLPFCDIFENRREFRPNLSNRQIFHSLMIVQHDKIVKLYI